MVKHNKSLMSKYHDTNNKEERGMGGLIKAGLESAKKAVPK